MPRLWRDTVEEHRRDVRDAVLDATGALVAARGPLAVTMSQIAEEAGIGRATLYKYFPDVGSALLAWHERHVAQHLAHLQQLRDAAGDPTERLEVVLGAYAFIRHHRGGAGEDLGALLHRGEVPARAEEQVVGLVRDLLAEAGGSRGVRDDVPAEELARYALHALAAAGGLPSQAAVRRLVEVTLSGLRPPS